MSNNQQQQTKGQGYINVSADLNFLQKIVCCNHNIANGPADTPRNAEANVKEFLFDEPHAVPRDAEADVIIEK